MQDELYFKHLGIRLNCSYTKNKLYMKGTLSVGRKTEEILIDAQRNSLKIAHCIRFNHLQVTVLSFTLT